MESRHLLDVLQSRLDSLPSTWKRLGHYLLTHLDDAVFLTASELAGKAETSESSVIRFARGFGYKGYPPFREELQVLLREKLRPLERLVHAGGVPNASEGAIGRVFELALANIQETRMLAESRALQAAATVIAEAESKHIIGLNASAGTAHLLGYHLGKILPGVSVHIDSGPMLFDSTMAASKRDVVVGVSYPRYAKATVEILRYARRRGARTVAITDSQLSPAAQIAEIALVARADSITFGNSYVAPSLIVDALVALVLSGKRDAALARLQAIDNVVNQQEFFYGASPPERSKAPGSVSGEEGAGSARRRRNGGGRAIKNRKSDLAEDPIHTS